MSDHIWFRCLECSEAGTTKPTKDDIGRDALRHVEATDHAVTTSKRGPVPERFSQADRIPRRAA